MTDRATFEAHFGLTLRQQQRHKDDRYTDPITQARWEGYQAAKDTFFAKLSANQVPLDPDMHKVLLENAWELYADSKVVHGRTDGAMAADSTDD